MLKKDIIATSFGIWGAALSIIAAAQVPAGYPSDYSKLIDEARKEGKVVVMSTTDAKEAAPLIKDFNVLYPAIRVEYAKVNSTDLFNRIDKPTGTQGAEPDVLWSSAMDLQVKLTADGHGLQYKTAELAALPQWAVLNNTAYGTTFEPIVTVYNKRLLASADVPGTHAGLEELIRNNPDKFKGKITTYDVAKSGAGFLFVTQDVRENPKYWDLIKSLGSSDVEVQASTDTMLDHVVSGKSLIGYNVIGSYALARAKKDPVLGIAFLKDYTVVLSRVMFINKDGQHPNAAKLWLDYILSKRGQTIIANEVQMYSVRQDVVGETTASGLTKQFGTSLKPIVVDSMLLRYLNQGRKQALIKEWKDDSAKK